MQVERRQSTGVVEQMLAVLLPLAMLSLAYALWAISDRLLYIGTLDRAAFGWMVVMPVAWATPGVAGLVWSRLSRERRLLAAFVVGGSVAIVSGVLLANGIDQVGCAPVTSWTDDLPRSLAVGVVVGAGPSLGAFVAASVALRTAGLRRVVATFATGAVIGFVGLFAAILAYVLFFPALLCATIPN